MVQLLPSQGADATFQYGAALNEATRRGHIEIVKLFVEEKQVDVLEALITATSRSNLKAARYLVKRNGPTVLGVALCCAADSRTMTMVKFFLKKGCKCEY